MPDFTILGRAPKILFNLISDPKEQPNVMTTEIWARTPMLKMAHDFRQSMKKHPPIPHGTADPYEPPG